jgi:peptide/nickel transport system permease protein
MSAALISLRVLGPAGLIGLSICLLHLGFALLGPVFVLSDPAAQNAQVMLKAPSVAHWFGTDRLGRDMFARTILGGREAMFIATLSTFFAMLWGGILGVLLGLVGRWPDAVLMRVIDAMMSIPWVLMVMLFIAIFGTGMASLIPVLSFSYGLSVVYLARAATLSFVAEDFIWAAKARGHSPLHIVTTELLPNVQTSLAVQGAMQWSWIFLGVSSLSFLGMGVMPPTPDWGQMIADGRGVMQLAPWVVFWPMLALSSLVIGVNLFVDALARNFGIDRALPLQKYIAT